MAAVSNFRLSRLLKRFSQFAGLTVFCVGVLVLVGWILDIPTLKDTLPGNVTIKFNTGLCFTLAGLSLLLLQAQSRHPLKLRIVQISAVAIALVGLLTICEYLYGWDLGIDQWLVRESVNGLQGFYPGRMTPITAINFLLQGTSLFLFGRSRALGIAQGLALIVNFFSLLAVIGYLYGAEELYRFSIYTSVVLPTALTLLVLSLGILLIRPDRGLIAIITTQSAGGLMARRLLFVSNFLPILLGWLALQGVNAGFYNAAFSAAIAAVSSVIILSILILWNAQSLQRMEEALRKSHDELELRVQERTADLTATNLRLEAEVLRRQQVEAGLAQERNLLRTLIDNLPDNIFVKDVRSQIIIDNIAHRSLLGVTKPEEVAGKTDFDFFSQELASQYFANEQAIIQSGQATINQEEPTVDPSGNKRWLLTTKVPLQNEQGEMIGIVGVNRDITERRQAEETLNNERRLLRTLIDNLPDYIFTKDLAGRFVISNLAHARAANVSSPEALVGKTAFELFPPEFASQFHSDDLSIMTSGQAMINVERMTVDADGSPRTVLTTKVPLQDATGTIVGLVGISHDISEWRRIEQALQESEARLAGILETAHEAIICADETQRIILYNTGAEQVFGYSRDETVGQSLDLLLPDSTREIHHAHVANFGQTDVMARRMAEHQAVYGRHKNGQEFPVEASISQLKIDDHRIFTVVLRDVTTRKQAEATLRQSEAAEHEQRILAETLRDTALALNSNLEPQAVMDNILINIERVVPHDAANIMLIEQDTTHLVAWRGYPPEVTATFSTIHFPLETTGLQEMIATRAPVLISHTEADPGWIKVPVSAWVRSYVSAPIEVRGQVIGFLNLTSAQPGFFTPLHAEHLHIFAAQAGIAIDNARLIEALRHYTSELEQRVDERTLELQQAKEHVESILNYSSDAILVIGANGTIHQVNPTFSDLFGFPPNRVLGQSLTALVGRDDAERLTDALASVVSHGTSSRTELEAIRKDGTVFSADVGLAPIQNGSEVVCSIRDITEHKRAERELQELNRLKTEFLSTAAHELRTPLTSILGFSELLITRELDASRGKRYLQLIYEQSVQLQKIIAALLDISRLESKQGLALDLQPVNLSELVDKVVTPFAQLSPKHQFQIEGLSACPSVSGDSFRINQVLQNLVSNAVKYSPEGGTVTIRGKVVSDFVEVSVQDMGIGMTPQQQSHLFERFYRADASNTTLSGTGLGLAISKLIIELHGGTMWVESQYRVGTTCYFRLSLNVVTTA